MARAIATREAAIADLFDYIEVFYNRSRATRRSAMFHRGNSLQVGSAVSMSKPWQHDPVPWGDEKQREAQTSNVRRHDPRPKTGSL